MTEKRTNKEEEYIKEIDKAITELVYDKVQLQKAWNYYHGKRDAEQFKHLEENYGIGTPTSVEFVPLVKKHIDVLIGEYLSTPVLPKISCKDSNTLSSIHRSKQLAIHNSIVEELNNVLNTAVSNAVDSKKVEDPDIMNRINSVKEGINNNFISEYELAAQNIVDYAMQSRNIDFTNKRKQLAIDLLVTGTTYFRTIPNTDETNVEVEDLNTLDTFIDRNPKSPYLKHSARSVVRRRLNKHEILQRYGKYLSDDNLKVLETLTGTEDGRSNYVRGIDTVMSFGMESDGILGGFEVAPVNSFDRTGSNYFRTFLVYEVEWLQTDKENGEYVMNRYHGVRIGDSIYIPFGKDEKVARSIENPRSCNLTVNGLFYSDRNGDPFSLVLATANLQDKYDCINFFRDNIIAESGGIGDWVDVAHLPAFLGSDIPERLMKYKAYKKAGISLYDSSQEGEVINTAFNGYDDTIKVQTIQAFNLALQQIEETCSTITGVFRERLGGIEQKDAVTNVQVGVTQSSLITKQYYQIMDLITREILLDVLNVTKLVFKKGITGSLILGDRLNKIFTALPEHYTITDHDIHITDSSEIKKEIETMKTLAMEFTKNQMVSPDVILEVITATGLTKMKMEVTKALGKQKQETNQMGKLNEQVQTLDQQLKQATSELQKAQQQIQSLNAEKLQIEKERAKDEREIGWYKAKSESTYNDSKLKLEEKRVDLEGLQLIDASSKNDEIKNN